MNGREVAILPGSWLGVFGGGQLGRMFVHAAQRLGYHVAILDREENCPAAQAADRHFGGFESGSDSELEQVKLMAQACSAVTFEFENVSSHLVRLAQQRTLVRPNVDFLEMCQDREQEKNSLQAAGFATTPFRRIGSAADIPAAATDLGWPLVLKTARSGYDGKGQIVVRNPSDVESAWNSLQTDRAVAEQWIEFQAEVSILCARNLAGQIETYPLFENEHANHILDVTRCPVRGEFASLEQSAAEIARGVADQFAVEGLFCIEFFISGDGRLIINEIAPRPHNSGHLTIEAFNCSQFEQQVRAVCNLPLAQPIQIAPAAMANLLGDHWANGEPNWQRILRIPQAHLHLYGKSSPRKGRKMGHLTCVSESTDAASLARRLRESLRDSD